MTPRTTSAAGVLVFTLGAALAIASVHSAFGPEASATNAPAIGGKPAEFDCTLCHDTNPINSGPGALTILGVPDFYVPSQVYPLTVQLQNSATSGDVGRKWGFEFTAIRNADGNRIGTLQFNPDTLQLIDGEGSWATRKYLEHKSAGTRTGLASPVTWTFSWQAPASDVGLIHFYCAGNSANGNGAPTDDWIFTTHDSSFGPSLVGVRPVAAATSFAAPSPNPTAGKTALAWTLGAPAAIQLAIYDAHGRLVRRLAEGPHDVGPGGASWDGLSDLGVRAPSGVYFARLRVPARGESLVKTIVVAH
jgi:hypothetical protein